MRITFSVRGTWKVNMSCHSGELPDACTAAIAKALTVTVTSTACRRSSPRPATGHGMPYGSAGPHTRGSPTRPQVPALSILSQAPADAHIPRDSSEVTTGAKRCLAPKGPLAEIVFWTSDTGIGGQTAVDLDEVDLLCIQPLPSRLWYQDMADFADHVSDEQAGRRLARAIQGSGAFRRLKAELHEEYPHLLPAWYAFRDARAHRRAVEWLADNSLLADAAAALSRRTPAAPRAVTRTAGYADGLRIEIEYAHRPLVALSCRIERDTRGHLH